MDNETKFAIEEVKTLILIGGFPCFVFIFLSVMTGFFFPDDSVKELKIIAYGVISTILISIFIIIKRIWKRLK